MKKILVATTNKNKVERIKKLFTKEIENKEVEFFSMNDVNYKIPEPEENGSDYLENAKIKAGYYYQNLTEKIAVLSQDDSIFLEGVAIDENPGKDIKAPVIKKYDVFNDENAYKYYQELFNKYGGILNIEFRYGFAMATEGGLFAEKATLSGRVLGVISAKRTPGYFLADMMQVLENNKWEYYNSLTTEQLIKQDHSIREAILKLIKEI